MLARYGGEEFAVILPDVDADGATVVANRLVQAVRTVTIRQAAGWQVSVSVGAATCQPGADLGNYSELVALADTALYTAKAAGKNRAYGHHRTALRVPRPQRQQIHATTGSTRNEPPTRPSPAAPHPRPAARGPAADVKPINSGSCACTGQGECRAR